MNLARIVFIAALFAAGAGYMAAREAQRGLTRCQAALTSEIETDLITDDADEAMEYEVIAKGPGPNSEVFRLNSEATKQGDVWCFELMSEKLLLCGGKAELVKE